MGHIQKVINMSFKYLYCIEEFRTKYEGYFLHCHMPLDRYTISWFKEKCDNSGECDIQHWSKMDNYDQYKEMQKSIRDYIEKQSSNSVLENEFTIWRTVRDKMDLVDFEKSAEKILKNESATENELIEIIKESNGKQ